MVTRQLKHPLLRYLRELASWLKELRFPSDLCKTAGVEAKCLKGMIYEAILRDNLLKVFKEKQIQKQHLRVPTGGGDS